MAGPSSLAHLQSTPEPVLPLAATGIAPEVHEAPRGPLASSPLSSQSQGPWPTKEQQRDIAALSTLSDFEIFKTLNSLRSLSNQHLQALVNFRSVPDDYIRTWLDCGRRISGMIRRSLSGSN